MFDGPEYDRNGKINQSAYSSDEYDFFKIMYGDKGERPRSSSGGFGTIIWLGIIIFLVLLEIGEIIW